ncbi:hypothetical protein CNMCM5793_006136 [Aspergillus hiratsukae]|uniref:Glutamine synthetase n=1 Tax=Aspergillus hiratsukae TaxID=1194566 RepID=A0A8H6UZM2_9EURO|nr:hypothetical protein CNMCM5793_006136 [Aspergillus hiratsukae]KAF7168605.1 hypothetical protein CNMCM6106_003764 [Aspergillus hiratsukae]
MATSTTTLVPGAGSPSKTSHSHTDESFVQEFLHTHSDVQFIRFQWVDLSGILRARCLPESHALKLARTGQPLRCGPITVHALADNSVMPDLPRSGVHELHPDWASLRTLGSGSSAVYAAVMCSIVERLPPNGNRPDSSICPRTALTKILHLALQQWGVQFLVGFEVELVILRDNKDKNKMDGDPPFVPLCSGPGHYCVASTRDPAFHYLQECVSELINAGVGVHDFHVEGTLGQFEIALMPLPPMQAVDELVRVHDMLKTTVGRHGYTATMVPKLPGLRQGSGEHIHVSLAPTEHEEHFLAGLLRHLPGLCAVTMPYTQSYSRIGKLEAGECADWGTENRDVAVRKVECGHWEIRCADASANMYLALATILAAGLLGIQERQPLRLPDASASASSVSDGSHGTDAGSVEVPEKLPRTFGDALQLLQASVPRLGEILQDDILSRYVALKQVESARLAELDQEEVDRLMVTFF